MSERKLSPREKEILELLSKEYTIKEIGNILGISHLTVASHKRNIMNKWNVKSVAGLIREGFKKGDLN